LAAPGAAGGRKPDALRCSDPAMAAAAGGGAGGGPREPPHTLQGLLEMAVVAGEAALMCGPGAGGDRGELQRCLAVLAEPCPGEEAAERGPGDTAAHEQALEELAELCESLDNATDFCSLGGLQAVLGLLGHPWPPLRSGAARVLGACAQNLPGAQSRALALGALPALLGALRGDPDPRVPPAALFAISCELGGGGILGIFLGFFWDFLGFFGIFLGPLLGLGLVPRVVALLRSEHDGAHEHGLGTLYTKKPQNSKKTQNPKILKIKKKLFPKKPWEKSKNPEENPSKFGGKCPKNGERDPLQVGETPKKPKKPKS
uniref:Uncharacterized protein n=1 Tax=Catharus ustulatus TaxID=91951 RepID=A0A8C3Y0L8_CATUS